MVARYALKTGNVEGSEEGRIGTGGSFYINV